MKSVPTKIINTAAGPAIESDVDHNSRACFRWSLQLRGGLPKQATGDDELLDLLGALEDVHDLGVSGPLLQQVVFRVADAAAQFHAAQRDRRGAAACLGLGV